MRDGHTWATYKHQHFNLSRLSASNRQRTMPNDERKQNWDYGPGPLSPAPGWHASRNSPAHHSTPSFTPIYTTAHCPLHLHPPLLTAAIGTDSSRDHSDTSPSYLQAGSEDLNQKRWTRQRRRRRLVLRTSRRRKPTRYVVCPMMCFLGMEDVSSWDGPERLYWSFSTRVAYEPASPWRPDHECRPARRTWMAIPKVQG